VGQHEADVEEPKRKRDRFAKVAAKPEVFPAVETSSAASAPTFVDLLQL